MIETDKCGDVRRGANRFSRQIKQSGHKFISGLNGVVAGDFVSPDKYTKERIKKLSAVNRASSSNQDENYEMGCDIADREESLPSQAPPVSGGATSKKFKLLRKQFFDDCNGVDHVSVPRKLRSAMKKRNRESTSPPFPDSKKLNYSSGGAESPKRVGIKRLKLNLKQGVPNWSLKQSVDGPITKDEEEVAETLYALAGMFPDNETDSKSKTDNASLDASASALPGPSESHPSKLEAMTEDLNVNCLSRTDEAVNPATDIESSPEETTKAASLNGPSIHELFDFHSSEKLEGSDSLVAQVKSHKMFVKHEEQKPPCNSVNFCFPPEPLQDHGKLMQPARLDTLLLDRKPEITLGLTTTFGSQLDQQHMTNEFKKKGPASWPGFSSTLSSTFYHGPLLQSCAAKIPAWFGTRPRSLQNDSSTGKVFKVSTDRRSWKRCASHVYICWLIRALQVPETKESLELPPNKLKPHEILKQGVLMTINEFNSIRNDLNGVPSSNDIFNTTKKNSSDTKIGNVQHLRLQQDHSQAALASGAYTSQKQSFNFLYLSAGGGGMEPNISYNGTGTCSEPLAQLQVPYPSLMPFSMSQTRYTSGYPDSAAAAAAAQQAQLQLHPHFSSPYCGPPSSPKALTKQQQLWAAQLAQYRNAGTSTAMTHFPSWQNKRQDLPAMIPWVPPSPATLEVLGHEYPHVPHQQQHQNQHQQFVAINLSHGRIKRQDSHLSSVYEETGVGFRAGGGALPLQLLCTEHL